MVNLDLELQNSPPLALPTCIWKSVTLWSNPTSSSTVDLSSLAFHEALVSIYKKISFIELCQVLLKVAPLIENSLLDREALFQSYQFRYDQKTEKILLLFPQFSPPFLKWCQDHALSATDLYPLCSSPLNPEIQIHLDNIVQFSLSRSQGAQALEWIVDCSLLGRNTTTIRADFKNGTEWLEHLRQLRFPQTQNRDIEKQKKLLSPWPKSLSPRWQRQGDRSGVEIRFMIGSKKELGEKISILNRVYNDIHD